MSDLINETSPEYPLLKQSRMFGIISSPTDEIAFDNLNTYVGELIDKIRCKYPSLRQWQVYVIVSGLINNVKNGIDEPEYEKSLSIAVLLLNEAPNIQ